MTEQTHRDDLLIAASPARLARRRALFFALAALTSAGLISLLAVALSAGGFGVVDVVILILFAVTLPWSVTGFWNAFIGLLVMRFARDPVALVMPVAGRVKDGETIDSSTAILLCIRNEAAERVTRHITPLMEGLVARGIAKHFALYVLSDTDDSTSAAHEERQFDIMARAWRGHLQVTYRRRENNTGYKAGNVWDFCDRWGDAHDFALVLDADSLMTADGVLRLVRIMQADRRIGILQSLVIAIPTKSGFARIFQFGMRLGMRSYTLGSAWWQGDCGPYWGHNALIRLAPFMAHCKLPVIADSALVPGHAMSHDQIEAVLMRRAGYEVRVLPEEGSSFEQNPPNLIEFIRRDLRWCQGNMQYWHFLSLPGLKPVSRYQLLFAIFMFLGSPAWIGLLLVATLSLATGSAGQPFIRPDAGVALLGTVLLMWVAPKIATAIDVMTRRPQRIAFGGGARFLGGVLLETAFFLLLSPIMWLSHSVFLLQLLFGRVVEWTAQTRDDQPVAWSLAFKCFWLHSAVGLGTIALLATNVPSAIPYALLLAGGPLLSVPFTVFTASPLVGDAIARLGVCRLPEEGQPLPEMRLCDPIVGARRPVFDHLSDRNP